jgi:hypothetical protein
MVLIKNRMPEHNVCSQPNKKGRVASSRTRSRQPGRLCQRPVAFRPRISAGVALRRGCLDRGGPEPGFLVVLRPLLFPIIPISRSKTAAPEQTKRAGSPRVGLALGNPAVFVRDPWLSGPVFLRVWLYVGGFLDDLGGPEPGFLVVFRPLLTLEYHSGKPHKTTEFARLPNCLNFRNNACLLKLSLTDQCIDAAIIH